MTALTFQARDGQLLKLDASVVATLLAYRQRRSSDTEAGGTLLGRWIRGSYDVVADACTRPTKDDKRTRTSFFRSARPHQDQVDAAMGASGGTCGYIGEWHTHPEGDPTPSNVDTADWSRRLRKDRVDVDYVFFVIVGTAVVRAWRGCRNTHRIEPLEGLHGKINDGQ